MPATAHGRQSDPGPAPVPSAPWTARSAGLADDVLARLPYSRTAVVHRIGADAEAEPARLRIHALGELRVEGATGALDGAWLDQRPGELLRFLVSARHRVVAAEAIAEAIWPHVEGRTAPNTVRHFVHALRERLEPERERHAASAFVVCRRGGYALDAERVWLDVDAFERAAGDGLRALAVGDGLRATERLEAAVALYRDDLLADEPYAEWALRERERVRALACDALRALAELRADDPAAAAEHLDRLAEMEPFDDDVQRQLITAWLRLGRKSRAARHYESFRVRLAREFGQRPAFELSNLP